MATNKDDIKALMATLEQLKTGSKPVTIDEDADVTLADIFDAPSSNTANVSTASTIQIGVQHVNPSIGIYDVSSIPMSMPTFDETVLIRFSDTNFSCRTATLKDYVEMKVMAALREIVEGK